MLATNHLAVTSHVGRDILQSAALFKHEWLVVWEYVANGLQYVDPGTTPTVRVIIESRPKKILVSDNGRGMSWSDLQNYFVMHGENIDRKQGRAGRGYFGTGKSAAFGIAQTLRITTVRHGLRSKVELSRSDIEAAKTGAPIPVRTLEKAIKTDQPNGTVVEVEDVLIKSLDAAHVIKFIERHIAHWSRAIVAVNNHLCEYAEPPVAREYKFRPENEPFLSTLGDAELVLKVAKAPLDEGAQGIAILSSGIWYQSTLAGSERKEMAQYIFGEFDVPALSTDNSRIPAFDQSRSMQLNPNNELAQMIVAFIGQHVEVIRRGLVDEEKRRRASEEAKRLEQQANKIAEIINKDFDLHRQRLQTMKSKVSGGKDALPADDAASLGQVETLEPGGDIPSTRSDETEAIGRGDGVGGDGVIPPAAANPLVRADDDKATERAQSAPRDAKQRRKGGFRVEFANLGASEPRARYVRETRTIIVNLDQPQLAHAAEGVGTEDANFLRLAYDVAFAEYSIALAQEMAQADHFIDFYEPLTVTRETLDRVTRAAAHLFAPSGTLRH